jgi:FMNH2-dependent dimethyl sulfone monooxygenase
MVENRLLTELANGQFLLGTFASNCDHGLSITKIPERWNNSFENNLKLAQMLDEAGIEFMLPIARWIGYGGETDYHGNVLETVTWATGLLALTKRVNIIATIHTSVNNPVVVAKQITTIDQISNGRIGLNIVAGWNQPEYEALGLEMKSKHEDRYAYAQDWFNAIKKLWSKTKHFDHEGEFFKLKRVLGDPRPAHRIPIINAAGSGEGRAFATRNTDILFTPAIDLTRSKPEIAELKKMAKDVGREVGVLTLAHVVCRPTEQEAKDYVKYYAETNADWGGVDNLMELQFAHAKSYPLDLLAGIRSSMAVGQGGYQLIGTPQMVADGIMRLKECGFNGTTLSFVDYVKEFPYFRDNVLPLLEKAGIRHPVEKI